MQIPLFSTVFFDTLFDSQTFQSSESTVLGQFFIRHWKQSAWFLIAAALHEK